MLEFARGFLMPPFKYEVENADNAPIETWQELPDQQEAIKVGLSVLAEYISINLVPPPSVAVKIFLIDGSWLGTMRYKFEIELAKSKIV